MFPPDQTAELSTPAGRKPPRADIATAADSMPEGRSEHRPPSKVGVWEEGAVINDRYTLERRLGGGSMGEVFLATDRLLKKPVALKVLRADLAKNRGTVRRFLREVALAHSVTHPNVVRIYDTGEADGLPFFSMEHLQGQTLETLIEAGRAREDADGDPPMTLREIREISYEILSGLAAAHEAGIVHRDLKPANVMLTHRGAIVMDFGVAGFDAPTPGVRPNPAEARSLVKTEAGTIFGSPAYMAPELWEGASATVQSDLYSFGVMLYQMLAGRLPIEAPNAKAFLVKLKEEKPTPVRQLRKDTPWNLALLVSKCMTHDPDRRPISATAAANLVAPFSAVWLWTVGAIVLASIIAVGAWAWFGRDPSRHAAEGLPDAIASADLDAIVRSFDVGDYESAERMLGRLEQRAPRSAAVVFWRAMFEHAVGDEAERWNRCLKAGYVADGDGSQWDGDTVWRELAMGACAASFSLSSDLRALLDPTMASELPASWLPIAVSESLVPRIESARDMGSSLRQEADDVLRRLDAPHEFGDGPTLAIRWQLARFDLRLARGAYDEARNLLDDLVTEHPEAPIVIARAAQFYALAGELERAEQLAKQVARDDPRPSARLLLDAGRLDDAAALIDRYALRDGSRPLLQQLVDTWCAYAYAFEIPLTQMPQRCAAMGPGLAHNMWIGAYTDVADTRAMSSPERAIVLQQAAINRGECLARDINTSIVTHTIPPFETYLRQLDIYAARCLADDPDSSSLQLARRLADDLVAVAPGDPWALLTDAQIDADLLDTAGATDKRRAVVERWRHADDDLPLVLTVRGLVGETTPSPEPTPEPAEQPETREPELMTPIDIDGRPSGAPDGGEPAP